MWRKIDDTYTEIHTQTTNNIYIFRKIKTDISRESQCIGKQ